MKNNIETIFNEKKVVIITAAIAVIAIIGIILFIVLSGNNNKNNIASTSDNSASEIISINSVSAQSTDSSSIIDGNNNTTEIDTPSDNILSDLPSGNISDTSVSDNSSSSHNSVVASSSDASGTPVANHGKLSVDGTQLVDSAGKPYMITGVSTHGLGWFPEYVNMDSFKTLRDEWGANCVRLAMYTAEYNGYCSGGNKESLKTIVKNGVSYATDLGMYVIIDWHILSDNNPNTNKAEAISFFSEMSELYADYDNVIYEICNEPNGGTDWASIKSYALEVIPVIKANNPDAIIIVGTPTWSQDVDLAAADPITGYTNIMYALHFYADTHRDSLRSKMQSALNAGIPIFVSEFGITDASGNGAVNITEANTWINTLNSNGVSYCIWSLSNKNESSALINSSCSKTSGWTTDDLSEEGKWYVGILGGNATGTVAPTSATQTSSTTNTSGSASNSTASTSAPAASTSSGNKSITLTPSGSWNDGTNNYYQYTLNVKNTGSGSLSNWKISINFGTDISLDQSWSGNVTVSGNTVTISGADFNSTINAGDTAEAGFIIYTSGNVGTPNITVIN